MLILWFASILPNHCPDMRIITGTCIFLSTRIDVVLVGIKGAPRCILARNQGVICIEKYKISYIL